MPDAFGPTRAATLSAERQPDRQIHQENAAPPDQRDQGTAYRFKEPPCRFAETVRGLHNDASMVRKS